MAKYIDADKLKNNLLQSGAICDFGLFLIEKQPAVDVQKVKRGEWVRVSDDDRYEGCYFCSECKEAYFNPSDDENIMLPNFCPNCGAKMDGKEGEE